MKKNTWAALALSAVMGSGIGMAYALPAEAQPQYKMATTKITWNGIVLNQPQHIVAPDPWSNGQTETSWLPIWYLFPALQGMKIQPSWDGHILNLQVPNSMPVDLTNLPKLQMLTTNTMSVQVNGQTVLYAPKIAYPDPASKKPTTYVPEYYVMLALRRAGIQSTWDGTTWGMTYGASTNAPAPSPSSSGQATKLKTALDFARVLHIQGDSSGTNPYSDVPDSDWPVIHALVEKGYFAADSATAFGASDAVPISMLEHAYQLYCGIPDSHMAWNPGGNLAAWSDAIQLTKGVQSKTGNLSAADEQQMMQNLTYLYQGYSKDPDGTYHLWMKPWDGEPYYNVTQDLSFWKDSQYVPKDYFEVTAQQIQQDLAWAYHYIDSCTVTYDPKTQFETFKIPGVSSKDIHMVTVGFYSLPNQPEAQYSLDGGKTWHESGKLDGTYLSVWNSIDPIEGATTNPPSYVYARENEYGEIGVTVFHDPHGKGIDLGGPYDIRFDINGTMHVKY